MGTMCFVRRSPHNAARNAHDERDGELHERGAGLPEAHKNRADHRGTARRRQRRSALKYERSLVIALTAEKYV
jgi:hypothetical protein